AFGRAFVDQRDGLGKRDRILVLVARDRRVDATGRDIGAIAAVLDRDRAKRWMIAKRLAGILAEAAAARALGHLLCNQSDRAVQPDVEDLVARLQRGIGLVVLHERAE